MDTIPLSYKELAARMGVKPESARKTAQRKRWHRTTGNDGTVRIHVPVDALPVTGDSSRDSHGDSPDNPVHVLIARLEAENGGLQDLVAAERRRADAAEGDRDAWRDQAQRLALAAPVQKPGIFTRLFGPKAA